MGNSNSGTEIPEQQRKGKGAFTLGNGREHTASVRY